MPTTKYTPKIDIRALFEVLFIAICITSSIMFISYTVIHTDPRDFDVYYYSAQAALDGGNIYSHYGPSQLPYWYFPWLAWLFIPLAFFSYGIAYTLYTFVSIVCAVFVIAYLVKVFIPETTRLERFFVICMSLILCWLLFSVGQMDFILLGVALATIHLISKGKASMAGLVTPILLFKPHLFILFGLAALIKGKKWFLLSAAGICGLVMGLSFILIPNWPQEMQQMLARSGQRTDNNWNFTTFPNMLGMQENWSGTANLPFTIVLIGIGFVVLWRFRSLPTFPFLALALAGSLFCAPRAYAYNFPFLLPAMIWVCSNWSKSTRMLFWLVVAIIPFLFRFSSGSYSIVLVIFLLSILKANKLTNAYSLSEATSSQSSFEMDNNIVEIKK